MVKIATSGNKGKGVRSDCFVTLELTDQGGIQLELESKVAVMYGASIRQEIGRASCRERVCLYV